MNWIASLPSTFQNALNRQQFPNLDAYIAYMRRGDSWADHLVATACAAVLMRPIVAVLAPAVRQSPIGPPWAGPAGRSRARRRARLGGAAMPPPPPLAPEVIISDAEGAVDAYCCNIEPLSCIDSSLRLA